MISELAGLGNHDFLTMRFMVLKPAITVTCIRH